MSSQYHDPANVTNPEHAEHRIVQPGTYIAVYVALLVFTGITVGAAFVDLHILNPIIAVTIACVKAMIVILFFMHVIFQSKLIKMTVGAGFFTFGILIVLALSDYLSRAWGRW